MKLLDKLILSAFIILGIWSCKKQENRVVFNGGTAPVLTATLTDSIPLSFLNEGNRGIQLSWTNPNYQFNTGVSSLDVNYSIEIDTVGANFSSPNKTVISLGTNLSRTFTQAELNDYLLNSLQITAGVSHNIELRVISFLVGGAAALTSNALSFKVTPFAIPPKVEPPTDGTLWLTGDATTSGYANPLPAPYDMSQKFTMVSNTLYELTVDMKGGGAYKLIQKQGEWGSQYHMIAGGTWEGGDFEKRDADPGFTGPPSGGSYKITVDFQRGKYSVVKQ